MNPREEYKKLLAELKALQEQMKTETFTPEQLADVQAKLARAKELKAKVDDLDALQAEYAAYGADFDKLSSRGGVADRDRANPGDPNTAPEQRIQFQRIGQYIAGSDAYKRKVNNRFAVDLPGMWVPSADYALAPFERLRIAREFEKYALTVGGGLSLPLEIRPGTPMISPILNLRPTVRDALSNQSTNFNLIPFIRDDTDSETNAAAFFDADGANVKPESTMALIDDEAPVRTIATTFRIRDEMLDDVTGLRNFVDSKLTDFLRQAEDDALLNGTGTPPEIKGILNMDIQVADGTYFSGNPVAGVGEDREDIDRLVRAIRLVRRVGRATPSAILMSPAALEWFTTVTNTTGDYYLGNPFMSSPLPSFRGLPIVESDKIADDHALVLDGRFFTVYDRMQARVDAGYVDKDFAQNWTTLRAEERLALAGERPSAAVDVTFANAGA